MQVRDLQEAAYSVQGGQGEALILSGYREELPCCPGFPRVGGREGGIDKEPNELRGGPAVGKRGRVNIGGTEGGGTK